jgi:phosphomannomutase
MNVDALLKRAISGFESLDISPKYKESAANWLEVWLTDESFKDYVHQIEYLITAQKWNFLMDFFYQVIPFGTGGRRGLVGIGPNRINMWTIQASAQGHAQYVMNLDGKQLAVAAARVYAANEIAVYMFESARSTPELSFAIRHLDAISGDMFSASHNLPTDNGIKVYDQYGGQLIPPDDQNLVDEVTRNVKEIKTIDFDQASTRGLIEFIGEEVDEAYFSAVCQVSQSEERNLKIIYSPLHGTGLTSVYPVFKKLGFNVTLDPPTSNLSGQFENVSFNIPNPEVVESFDHSLPFAKEMDADILINTDPDAGRIGVMLKHKGSWNFLSGNQIGIILTNYAISRYKSRGRLSPDNVIIKTGVTTSLIKKIADENNVQCIVDQKIDRWEGDPQPHLSRTDSSARNILIYQIDNRPDTTSMRITVRPSGTEPKIKMYFEVFGKPFKLEKIDSEKDRIINIRETLEKNFMQYCYKLLNVDFPDRGFLLFWQLPLDDKLKYFEIEEQIANLKSVVDEEERKAELYHLLSFLGANPIEKVNKAFQEKYKAELLKYLELS